MNLWKNVHYSNEEVIICFVESWFSKEYYVVYWKWAKPSSWREKIFGCKWNKIYEYLDFRTTYYNDDIQWDTKTYLLDSSLIETKCYVSKNIHTYQEMADYFGITESKRLYEEAKQRYIEKEIKNRELREQLYAKH